MKEHKWDAGDPTKPEARTKFPWEVQQEENTIQYPHDPAVWHWAAQNRPVRCATHLTVYKNTSSNGLTVTDIGLETPNSYKDTFGAHPSKGDVNFVSARSNSRPTPDSVDSLRTPPHERTLRPLPFFAVCRSLDILRPRNSNFAHRAADRRVVTESALPTSST